MATKPEIHDINEIGLKKILKELETRVDENQKLRIKHPDDPNKFASSETELYAILDQLQGVSTQPELYSVLVARKSLKLLITLLSHENADISAKVVSILQEFTDVDEDEEHKSVESLTEALRESNAIAMIVANLDRYDHSVREEAQAISNSLSIIDNLIDFDSSFASIKSDSLIRWMMKKLKGVSEFNPVKLSIAELLSVLLISSPDNKTFLNQENGIDILMQQMAHYRRVAPVTGDEHEYLEQTINCLCTSVLDSPINKRSFLEEEGVDLIELILREKREAIKQSNIKKGALKLFNHVLTSEENKDKDVSDCCERFIKVLGLRVLFPIFKNPKLILNEKIKKREFFQFLDEVEEHTTAIILALLKYCQDSELLQRILIKFAESNYEKFGRLIELHKKYFRAKNTGEDDGEMKSSFNFTLRTIDYIILLLSYLGEHFETYDPNSGETITSRISKTLAKSPELRYQIIMEIRLHLEEVKDSLEEQNSLELLLKHFESVGRTPREPVEANKET